MLRHANRVVARFFFHVGNGHELRDDGGMDLNSLKAAREEALLTASELLGGDGKAPAVGLLGAEYLGLHGAVFDFNSGTLYLRAQKS